MEVTDYGIVGVLIVVIIGLVKVIEYLLKLKFGSPHQVKSSNAADENHRDVMKATHDKVHSIHDIVSSEDDDGRKRIYMPRSIVSDLKAISENLLKNTMAQEKLASAMCRLENKVEGS